MSTIGSDLLARSSRRRTVVLALMALLLAFAASLAVLPSRAGAVVVTPTNFPLPGSNFQAGDGDEDNPTHAADATNPAPFPLTVDWQNYATGLGAAQVQNDPNALDS